MTREPPVAIARTASMIGGLAPRSPINIISPCNIRVRPHSEPKLTFGNGPPRGSLRTTVRSTGSITAKDGGLGMFGSTDRTARGGAIGGSLVEAGRDGAGNGSGSLTGSLGERGDAVLRLSVAPIFVQNCAIARLTCGPSSSKRKSHQFTYWRAL
jgi:hypothetical protein